MKPKPQRTFTPFRRRLWLIYSGVLLVLWLLLITITLGFTQRHYEDRTPSPALSTMPPVLLPTPTPPPAAAGSVDLRPEPPLTLG